MADLGTLERALRNADAAGDASAARRFAAEITKLRSASAPQQPAAPSPEAQFEEIPWYQKAGVAADDIMRMAANGMTFGFADKISGALGGEGTEAERAKTEQARERAGSAGQVAEIGSAVATPMGLAGKGATLAGRLGTGAMKGLPGLAARSGLMAAEGAGYGALTALGNDEDIGKGAALGAAGGALGNVAGEAISSGVSKAAGAFNKKPVIPSVDEISQRASDAYKRAEQAGVIFTPNAVGKLQQNVINDLTKMGYDPALQTGAAAVVKRLGDLQGQNLTLEGLDTIRKVASNGYIQGNKSNNAAISRIIDKIDDIVASPATGDILAGDSNAAASALSEARDLWSRQAKIGRVEDAVNRADLRAASTGSGGNVDNATRQNIRRLAENPRGFSPDERAALETVVRGTPTQNALRLAGKLSPQGNGLMAMAGIGGTMANPVYGAFPLAGMAAKSLADRGTGKNVEKLVEIIRAGGKESATKAAPNAVQRLAQSKREALARALMSIGAFEAGTPSR